MGTEDLSSDKKTPCLVEDLKQKLAGFRVTASPLFPDFAIDRLLAAVTHCKIVKASDRRQVYFLETPDGGYFLKLSILIRTKDWVRHFFLPRRRWAEWHNLHRMNASQLTAAIPVLRGENQGSYPKMFFLLTEKVAGTPLMSKLISCAEELGQYLARLHASGVYHADLHPENIIIKPETQLCLVDVQEVYFLPWLPRWLRIYNLGKIFPYFNIHMDSNRWPEEFLKGYNRGRQNPITTLELLNSIKSHQLRHYRSRTKRCCKNSTEFITVKSPEWRGYKRRDFTWGAQELKQALSQAKIIKPGRIVIHQDVCIKIQRRSMFHQDRCLMSWKMSRALEVRDIPVPRALGYFSMQGNCFFLSEYLIGSRHLNDYLSSFADEKAKRQALKKLALWLKTIHDAHIWQKDFKSSNVLCRNHNYFLIDLDGVKIRRLSEENKIINLAQLNASLSNAVTMKDRLRFYYYYSDGNPSRQKRRKVYQKVWEITQTKSTANFGLTIEKLRWPGSRDFLEK